MNYAELAITVYALAEERYGWKDARYDVIVECMDKAEIMVELQEDGADTLAKATKWLEKRARGQYEVELNQAWDGPESCIGSSQYDGRDH